MLRLRRSAAFSTPRPRASLSTARPRLFRLGGVFRFHGDESFGNDRPEQKRVLRLIAGRLPAREFRTLHRAPVRMAKLVERVEDLARDRHEDAIDHRELRRKWLAGGGR